MNALRLLSLSVLLCMRSLCASAEYTPTQQKALSVIAPQFPHLKFVWALAEGDLDGDGIRDLALLLTGQKGENDPREERLFVLTGNADGSYKLLSVSGEFCHVRNFYNLDIRKNSLFVQAVHQADAASTSSFTLQFRYNGKIKDLELIGEESVSEEYETDSSYRVSVNYLTKTAVYSRHAGKRHKDAKARFGDSAIFRLQDFDCSSYVSPDTGLYIDENFKVHNRENTQ